MQSLFGAIRLAGGGNTTAYAAQGRGVGGCGWRARLGVRQAARRPDRDCSAGHAALLFTPFLYDYDLALLAVPLACLLAEALRTGWRPWEQLCGAVLFVLPLLARPAGMGLGVTLGPPLLVCLMLLLARRATA